MADTIVPMPELDRPTATFSLIYAGAVQSVHRAFHDMTPPDLNLLINTKLWSRSMLHAGVFDAQAFDARIQEILEAAVETVEFAPTSSLCIGGDLIQSAMGGDWCRKVSAMAQERTGVPTITAMETVSEALRHLGGERIALIAPFPSERMAHLQSYLTAEGFHVVASRGVATVGNTDIRDLPRELPAELTRQAVRAAGQVDAVYISCPVWRSDEVIDEMEQELGVPVITMFTPILWKAMQIIRYDGAVTGWGRLLEGGGHP